VGSPTWHAHAAPCYIVLSGLLPLLEQHEIAWFRGFSLNSSLTDVHPAVKAVTTHGLCADEGSRAADTSRYIQARKHHTNTVHQKSSSHCAHFVEALRRASTFDLDSMLPESETLRIRASLGAIVRKQNRGQNVRFPQRACLPRVAGRARPQRPAEPLVITRNLPARCYVRECRAMAHCKDAALHHLTAGTGIASKPCPRLAVHGPPGQRVHALHVRHSAELPQALNCTGQLRKSAFANEQGYYDASGSGLRALPSD
jgi:hypothetical protein